mmetsp:Transcript_19791/g.29034  ORF Transcript_19791/g.29034 Transcript_19791/m.29034 type:complete len:398 (+) Transcript_19791:463-1656(+)
MDSTKRKDSFITDSKANVALIGAGWWSQGWHLPHLSRNQNVNIVAIVDTSDQPKSNLNPHLQPLSDLAKTYSCPVFKSVRDMLDDPTIGANVDGCIVCTPHATHFQIGEELLREGEKRGKPMNILMEKPMTTNVRQAHSLHNLATTLSDPKGCFLVNHSANFRTQARTAREIVLSGKIGKIRHVTGFMASPLSWIFDDPSNVGWNEPDASGTMLGNGFAWGQSSHLLAWVYHVSGNTLCPKRVFCAMNHSERTGADVSHAATIICDDGITFSMSGTSLLPGNAHSDPPVGKSIRIKIFGTEGAIFYTGDDRDTQSGRLELRKECGGVEVHCRDLGFEFEDLDQEGIGPESLQSFIDACLGRKDYYVGADSSVGLKTIQTIDAMYRSQVSGNAEDVMC